MSWRATAYVKTLVTCPNGETITRSEKLVAYCIADDYRDWDGKAVCSMTAIADSALMTERTARYCVRSLERKGVLVTRIGGPDGTANAYSFAELQAVRPGAKNAPDVGQNLPQGWGNQISAPGAKSGSNLGQQLLPPHDNTRLVTSPKKGLSEKAQRRNAGRAGIQLIRDILDGERAKTGSSK